jgi:hypothetical protein
VLCLRSRKILYVLAILLVISIYNIREPNVTQDLYLFFNKSTIVASLFMIYLMYNNWDLMHNLCINSLYIIINMLILTLNTSIFIYLIFNFLLYDNPDLWFSVNWMPYSDCFIYSRTFLGFILSTRLTIHIFNYIFLNIKNPKIIFKYIFFIDHIFYDNSGGRRSRPTPCPLLILRARLFFIKFFFIN